MSRVIWHRTSSMVLTSSRVHGSSWSSREVVGFTTDQPLDRIRQRTSPKKLDAEVMQWIDANHLEIRKSYTQADVEPIFARAVVK